MACVKGVGWLVPHPSWLPDVESVVQDLCQDFGGSSVPSYLDSHPQDQQVWGLREIHDGEESG